MTIKEAFEYLSSECGIGMKNPFIALRNLVEAFGKVADEIDTSGDYVKKSGDTMTGPLTVEGDVTAQEVTAAVFKFEEPVLGGSISFTGVPGFEQVGIQVPNKSGTMVLSSTVENYTTAEHVVGRWIDGKAIYQKTVSVGNISAGTAATVAHGINNINMVINYEGIGFNTTESRWNSLPRVDDDVTYQRGFTIDSTNINIQGASHSQAMTDVYVTIWYTKSTT